MSPSCRVLVVGLGNENRGDDAVGLMVAKKIDQFRAIGVTVMESGTDALGSVVAWENFDAVICIDAAAPLTAPGHIHRFDLAATDLPRDIAGASTHAMGLVQAIELARALDQAPRNLIVYAVEGASFVCGAGVTRQVDAAIPDVVQLIVADIRRLQREFAATV